MTAVVAWLRNRGNREIFQSECLTTSPGVWLRHKLDHFSGTMTDWRWGYAINTLTELADMEDTLVTFWDSKKLVDGAGHQHKRGAGEAMGFGIAALQAAASFVQSPAHWQYRQRIPDTQVTKTTYTLRRQAGDAVAVAVGQVCEACAPGGGRA